MSYCEDFVIVYETKLACEDATTAATATDASGNNGQINTDEEQPQDAHVEIVEHAVDMHDKEKNKLWIATFLKNLEQTGVELEQVMAIAS